LLKVIVECCINLLISKLYTSLKNDQNLIQLYFFDKHQLIINESFGRDKKSYRLFIPKGFFIIIKIKIKDNAVDLTNTRMYINPFCEIAMQEAANLKAKKLVS